MSEAVGQPHLRVEGRLKVTGNATYAADRGLSGMLHAVLVCSTIANGRISSIQTRRALAVSGVVRVLTDFREVSQPFDWGRINFYGQPIAVVLATTLQQAQHGALLVEVRYNVEPAVTNIDKGEPVAVQPDGLPYPDLVEDFVRGDPEQALAQAHVAVDLSFRIPRLNHNPMELPATVAHWEGDRLTVWDKTQFIYGTAASHAKALGVPVENVRVIAPFVGGAFGSAGTTWPHQVLAAFSARVVSKPVKLVLTRKQMYSGIGYRPASRQGVRIGADAEGRFIAIIHEARSETARYGVHVDGLIGPARALYGSAATLLRYRVVPLDVHLPTYMRGPGWISGAFALESAVDELAHQLGVDPIDLRIRNEPATDPGSGLPFSSRRLLDCYAKGAADFGWSKRDPRPGARRDGSFSIGMGMAAAVYHAVRSRAAAEAQIRSDGTALVTSATVDMGPGTYTSMSQIAADTLGLAMDKVTFRLGDSDLPRAPIHAASQTTASVGSAVFAACEKLKDSLVRLAVTDPSSPLHGMHPNSVIACDGRLFAVDAPDRHDTYQQILKRKSRDSAQSYEAWDPGDVNNRYANHSYGAVFAEVAVDDTLGLIRVRRIYGCYDAGRIVNPKLALGQAQGGAVFAIGMALGEATQIDHRDGRIVNANMSDYLVPVNADIAASINSPEFDATFISSDDRVLDPIGVKGLGEVTIVGVLAAIANAVHNATGRRITDLPMTLEKLL